jgi:hypothetical protein
MKVKPDELQSHGMARQVSRAAATVVALMVAAPACDDGGTTTTTTPLVTSAPATTPAPTADTTSTSTSTSTTTTLPATTTTTLEDLRAQIAADYSRSTLREYDLLGDPSLDNLEASVAEVAVAGSDFHTTLMTTIQDLVAKGDRVIPNDPDILTITVESVELVGEAPYTEATVTSCKVENRKRVTTAENSPTGIETEVGDSGLITAYHTTEPVRLTDKGWLRYATNITGEIKKGQDAC